MQGWRQPISFKFQQWLYSRLPWRRSSPAYMQLLYLRYTDLASAVQQAEQLLADRRSPLRREERMMIERQLPVWRSILDGTLHEPHPDIVGIEAESALMEARIDDLRQRKEYQRFLDVAIQYLLSTQFGTVEAHRALGWVVESAAGLGQEELALQAAQLMLAQHDFMKALNQIRPSAMDIRWQILLPWPIATAVFMLEQQKGSEAWERILQLALKYKHVPPHPDIMRRVIEALAGYYMQQGRGEEAERLRREYGL